MNDPYSVLGVSPNASDEEIKRPIVSSPGSTIRTIIRTIPWPIWLRRR